MNLKSGQVALKARNAKIENTLRNVVEQSESLCLDDSTDREALIKKLSIHICELVPKLK